MGGNAPEGPGEGKTWISAVRARSTPLGVIHEKRRFPVTGNGVLRER